MEQQNKQLSVLASLDNLQEVLDFAETAFLEAMCPMKLCMKLVLCIEEVFVNIASYAYDNENGMCSIAIASEYSDTEGRVIITMEDEGREYNPLLKEDPDITLSADERQIGGLGVFIVKKTMDNVQYEYFNKKNILKMEKFWN